jgi:sugar transferase (PEP-CTERM/EpsH1 system associated)
MDRETGSVTRIRVMHVSGTLGHGGLEQGVLKVVRGLDPAVFEQTICTVWSLDYMKLEKELRVIPLDRSPTKTGYIGYDLLKLFRQERPHIVHSRNWPTIEAVLAARLARVPGVIHSEHGRDIQPLAKEPWRRQAFRRLCYRLADRVFAVSEELKAEYVNALGIPTDLFGVIRNGVDTEIFSPNPQVRNKQRLKIGAMEKSLVVGCVARLDRVKDHHTLLRGAYLAGSADNDIRLVLVGEGPEREGLQRELESMPGMREKVIFAGRSFDVAEWVGSFDVFVLPSLFEGISNTLLEAMSVGVPVIATRVGGNVEVIEEGKSGFLFNPGDAETLATLLKQLATDRELRSRMGAEARKRIERRFRLEEMMNNYTKLYLDVARDKTPSFAGERQL